MHGLLLESIDTVHRHIEHQIEICSDAKRDVDTIVLNGGLCTNPILLQSLRRRFLENIVECDRHGNERKIFDKDILIVDAGDPM